jgi:hypothetical protein
MEMRFGKIEFFESGSEMEEKLESSQNAKDPKDPEDPSWIQQATRYAVMISRFLALGPLSVYVFHSTLTAKTPW